MKATGKWRKPTAVVITFVGVERKEEKMFAFY